ncbi:unnamed protein product [Paramecium sonneborni]|uniref:14-3-3 domain-containing protein n=1 Tax=Paramecium sonneborni TaxID=65129 RepID=A0A8S1MZ19_9CILI|nr:unnamed protein product [Paramecium sonneborni]
MASREDLIYMAKLCEQTERFQDMITYIRQVAMMEQELSIEERNLLSISYKNYIGNFRFAMRVLFKLTNYPQQNQSEDQQNKIKLISSYQNQLEIEVTAQCQDLINVIDFNLLKNNYKPEDKIFFFQMKNDAFRYLQEFVSIDKLQPILDQSEDTQKQIVNLFQKEISKTDPIWLGLALSQAVFTYEVLNDKVTAFQIAKNAFDGAISELDLIQEDKYKDATIIIQLLRDNLILWQSDCNNQINQE